MMKYPNKFLTKLSLQQHQTKYAKIAALDINEQVVEEIEGAITSGGPISIDGSSALRRTCNLTIAAEPAAAITTTYWGLTHKFNLEIGLKNTIDPNYPDVIWLNQGIYVIKSFSINKTTTHLNINISGQDKMSKLNGEMGGLFPTQATLDTIEEVAKDGSVTYVKQHIRDIIRNMVHELGGEPWQNIIIEDLPDYGYELWNYMGTGANGKEMPMYLFRDSEKINNIKNMTIDQNKIVYRLYSPSTSQLWFVEYRGATGTIEFFDATGAYTSEMKQEYSFMLKNILDSELYRKFGDDFELGEEFTLVDTERDKANGEETNNVSKYKIQKIRQGDIAGYHRTPLIYPGDLIANAGETITSVLDKIKSILGEFEYFYDVDGKFIFRKKKIYVNNLFSPIVDNNTIEPFMETSQYAYEFEDDQLLTQISLSPSIGEVKNDFTIWGNRRSSSGGDKLPIHARYAVDKKPGKYTTLPYYRKAFNKVIYIQETPFYWYHGETIGADKNGITIYKWPTIPNEQLYIKENTIYKPYQEELQKDQGFDSKDNGQIYYTIKLVSIPENNNSVLYNAKPNEQGEYIEYDGPIDTWYEKVDNVFVECIKKEGKTKAFNTDETYYLDEDSTTYYSDWYDGDKENDNIVDWRELIYLMARDYYQHNLDPNFNIKIARNNSELAAAGTTGYEAYYMDVQAFWRRLYDPQGSSPAYVVEGEIEAGKYLHWSRAALYYPESLDFWMDFLDTGGEIDKYAISKIGRRPKVDTDSTSGVTAIFYKETPDIEFVVMPTESIETDQADQTHTPMFIQDNMKQLFTISSRGKSVNERIDELIWKHVCIAGGINMSCIPLYFLDVNTRVKYIGEDYIVNKITLPLTHNGMMQVTMSKVIKPI